MKKFTLLAVLLIFAGAIYAQQVISFDDFNDQKEEPVVNNEQKIQTIMNSFELKRISGFGGPTMNFTTINGEFALMTGGGGGLLINNFFCGGYGEETSNTIKTNVNNTTRDISFRHGGFWFGYEIGPKKLIHPVISSRIGWGKIKSNPFYEQSSDQVLVLIPTLSAEINFTRFFKINVGAEYRQTLNVTLNGLTNKDFSNAGVYVNFIFGWF